MLLIYSIISLGDINAAFASVAIKKHRRTIHITGLSNQDLEAWENTGRYRIQATIEGKDSGDVEKDDMLDFDYCVEDGYFDILAVARKEMHIDNATGAIDFTDTIDEDISDFYAGMLGTYRKNNDTGHYYGLDGKHIVVLESEDILDAGMISYIATKYPKEKVTIVAERLEPGAKEMIPKNIYVIHAPFDLLGR